MAYFVKSTRSIGLTQSVLHFNFKSGTLNQFNKTTFTPVTTKTFRMILTPGHLGIGVIEWQVNGYTVQ
ncbi:hypothetical protein EFT87_14075 [Schleiferilactobacillus harbinensis]|uniref:hypothetical protein n=1 Tax=Schleiferilactobacillus harbinensis TaxID=304207 RepID=UPI0021A9738D|nr:hypothetical protein [Schleiferilactobacillus harbinensis]MCT2909773.1 hypothetical protein [Schleiferilactobacillus harbinensis]